MSIQSIIDCMNVVSYYNPNMESLRDAFVAEEDGMTASLPAIEEGLEQGTSAYETLVRVQVGLANAIHDYTYNIINPLDSIVTKNVVREQIVREVFGIEAQF